VSLVGVPVLAGERRSRAGAAVALGAPLLGVAHPRPPRRDPVGLDPVLAGLGLPVIDELRCFESDDGERGVFLGPGLHLVVDCEVVGDSGAALARSYIPAPYSLLPAPCSLLRGEDLRRARDILRRLSGGLTLACVFAGGRG